MYQRKQEDLNRFHSWAFAPSFEYYSESLLSFGKLSASQGPMPVLEKNSWVKIRRDVLFLQLCWDRYWIHWNLSNPKSLLRGVSELWYFRRTNWAAARVWSASYILFVVETFYFSPTLVVHKNSVLSSAWEADERWTPTALNALKFASWAVQSFRRILQQCSTVFLTVGACWVL